jgi:hypothetical protein
VLGRPLSGEENAPAKKTQVVVIVAGQQTWVRDIDLAELLAVVDRTAALVGLGLYSI